MLITDIKELRLCFPTHAIDSIEPYTGFIDNSEHEFLMPPLGQPLYEKLCDWYDDNYNTMSPTDGKDVGYYNRLLLMAQRCVAFDAMSRSIDQQSISMNNAGVNMSLADDYKPADGDAISRAKNAYVKEAHASLNRLLYALEQWTALCPAPEDVTTDTQELYEIVSFWRSSRYFYLAAQLLIPSAVVLQEYLNIYDSREKFIQMLPDLHFIQEEQIAPAIGEDFTEVIIGMQISGGTKRDATAAYASQPKSLADDAKIDPMLRRLLHKLRKIMATLLESRTSVIRVEKQRKIDARDEGVRLIGQFRVYCQQHQDDILLALGLPQSVLEDMKEGKTQPADLQADYPQAYAYCISPMFVPYPAPQAEADDGANRPHQCRAADFNSPDMALHVTMPLL